MKFKVGDKVRVREDLDTNRNYGEFAGVRGMEEVFGSEARVMHVQRIAGKYYKLDIDDGRWMWPDEMLEPIEDPLTTKVEERNNKPSRQVELENSKADDPIKPDHYRKGEIDLYESWYRTYPFNEFRAGMQMIAERYMKRDKNDRVEDLNKAIYTLSRLKEYEELESSKKC